MRSTDTGEAAGFQRFTGRSEDRRRSLVTWILVLVVLAVMVNGCTTVGPDFVKPEAPTLDDWNETQAPGFDAGQADYSIWWQAFDDPVLHELVEEAYRQNLSLQIAGIRIYEARAQLGIAVGNLYPQQQMGFGELRANKLGQASNTFLASENFNSLRLGFDASWEMDIWGKYRRSVQSGLANLAATVASYDNMLVSLTAEVARNYIVIRTFEKRLAIAEQNIKLQEDSLRIAEVRFDNGAVSELDVTQARALLKDTQASVPRLASGLRQAQNALAILLGVLPGTIADRLAGPANIPTASEAVVIDIPNNLLRRRPDIRLSEMQIAAQSPQIGIAKADLYPQFYLLGTLGWHSTDVATVAGENSLGDIFSYKSMFWSVGPSFKWDILNYGRIKNRVRVEDARFQQLVVTYQDTVINAQREVEDAMVAYTRARDEAQLLKESVDAAQRSVELALIQYKEGLVSYDNVLITQRFLATQADQLTAVTGQVGTNLVATYKALGGGWQIRQGRDLLSEKNRSEMIERTSWGGLLEPEAANAPIEEKDQRNVRWPDW